MSQYSSQTFAISVRSAAGMPPEVIREVVVGGFELGGFVDCGVEDGGRVVEGVVLNVFDDGVVVGLLGAEGDVDVPVETDG